MSDESTKEKFVSQLLFLEQALYLLLLFLSADYLIKSTQLVVTIDGLICNSMAVSD